MNIVFTLSLEEGKFCELKDKNPEVSTGVGV